MTKKETIVLFLIALIMAIVSSAIEAFIIMWLWNWVAVGLFNAPHVGYWTAWGIMFVINAIRNLFTPPSSVK